jgi:clathrin heavy chain
MLRCGYHKVLVSLLCHSNLSYTSYYKSLSFYLQEQPPLLTDLLTVLIPRIDHSRVVRMFRQVDHIPLIRSYLIAVQHVGSTDLRFDTYSLLL